MDAEKIQTSFENAMNWDIWMKHFANLETVKVGNVEAILLQN